jgi:hypothetical protein
MIQQIGAVVGPRAFAHGNPVLGGYGIGIPDEAGKMRRSAIEDFLLVALIFQQALHVGNELIQGIGCGGHVFTS